MKKITTTQIVTILATLVTITVNVLASALPLNGQNTGEISDRFAIYFVPAGYVFSIWAVIYLGLLAYTIYQALPSQQDDKLLQKIAPAYWIGSLANIIWIFLWHYEVFSVTIFAMLTILVTLIYIFVQISKVQLNKSQTWLVKIPFSIYLGWISVATIANFSQLLFYLGWNGWGVSPELWAVIMIATATLLGLLMQWREKSAAYGLVLVWALVGIAQKQSVAALVANTAWVTAALLSIAVITAPFLKSKLGSNA